MITYLYVMCRKQHRRCCDDFWEGWENTFGVKLTNCRGILFAPTKTCIAQVYKQVPPLYIVCKLCCLLVSLNLTLKDTGAWMGTDEITVFLQRQRHVLNSCDTMSAMKNLTRMFTVASIAESVLILLNHMSWQWTRCERPVVKSGISYEEWY